MTTGLEQITDLVERFTHNLDLYRRPTYNETRLRREFVDPLFEALGWDVANKQGVSPRYQEVVHEDSLRDKGAVKAPDYCFRVGPERKFFVETKKPSVDLARDPDPAYQLRRYAWTAKLPLSILTDFEQFAVYDCRVKPQYGDKASTARITLLTFDQYLDTWNEIAGRFSRESVLRGDYDQYAATTLGKLMLTEKQFTSGSRGFHGQGKIEVDSKRYQCQCQMVEIHSKTETIQDAPES
jgi:hypothetical protein